MPLLAINHHYFRENATGQGIYPTTREALRASVEKIRQAGWRLGGQSDIMDFLAGDLGTDDFVCILTFDDGLKEQIEAIRFLDELNASALCFVPTAPLLEAKVLDVHKLQMIRSVVSDEMLALDLDRRFAFSTQQFDDELLEIQYRYDEPLSRRVKYFLNFVLNDEQRLDWITEYFIQQFGDDAAAARALYMDKADLRWLADRHLLGSHGHAHLPLATLSMAHAKEELESSFGFLSEWSGAKPAGVSYPFGGKSAVSQQVFDLASAAGYEYGFTMERGVNQAAANSNAMALQRIDTNDLEAWIGQGGLQNRQGSTK